MRSIATLGLLASASLAITTLPAAAQSTTPVETRPYGATITVEQGVRVFRPVSASRANLAPATRRVYVYSAKEATADRFAMFNSVPRNLRDLSGKR